MDAERVLKILSERCGDNVSAWAREHDISPAYVSDVLHRRREPGEKILTALGIERVIEYRMSK